MNASLLNIYSDKDLGKLFEKETGWKVDEQFVREFRQWLIQRMSGNAGENIPHELHVWLIRKVHEYCRVYLQ